MSIGVQKMVRSDLGVSGVMFTINTETGFDKVVVINSSYGLGEALVGGEVIPDEFIVSKPALEKGFSSILGRNLGAKDKKVIYGKNGTKWIAVPSKDRQKFSLTDKEVQ